MIASKGFERTVWLQTLKIASWNVNSLRVRLPHLTEWLNGHAPDVIGLQETKTTDEEFPRAELEALGYHVVHAGQKSYNGVALLSRIAGEDVQLGLPDWDDPQRRLIAATYADVRVVNVYIPNGSVVGSEKYIYKLRWLERLTRYLEVQLAQYPRLVLLGDFNIAPEDRDVHDPTAWVGSVMVSEDERAAFRALAALGLVDLFRHVDQEASAFSWWDYRAGAFRRNRGLRIDHILCSPALAAACRACYIDAAPRRLERPSDHAPVVAEINCG